jgi:hypothetical protein
MHRINHKKEKLLVLFFLISFSAFSQQESNIQIDSGNKNNITVIQTGDTASQKSGIALKKSNDNTVLLNQKALPAPATTPKKEPAGFNEWIKNTNNVVLLLISIATFIGLLWKGFPYIKKMIR